MNDENPLIQAVKAKMPKRGNGPEDLLSYILSHFDLVPKEEENEKPEVMNVQTQESHIP